LGTIKITFDNLIEVYDAYIEKHKIVDAERKRAIHWAMFYCACNKEEWVDKSDFVGAKGAKAT